MTRAWLAVLDLVDGVLSLPLAFLILVVAALLLGLLLYFYPRWIPRRWPWRRSAGADRVCWWQRRPSWDWRAWLRIDWRFWLHWRRRRRPARDEAGPLEDEEPFVPQVAADEVPAVPADDLSSLADRLAAQGRYAEAVRERLRAMVRTLVERGVLTHRPGWTVTELARAAAGALPPTEPVLGEAAGLFSEIWYAQRPADAAADHRMRELAAGLDSLTAPTGVPA